MKPKPRTKSKTDAFLSASATLFVGFLCALTILGAIAVTISYLTGGDIGIETP